MRARHIHTGQLVQVLHTVFHVETQQIHDVYVELETGRLFSITAENFALLYAKAETIPYPLTSEQFDQAIDEEDEYNAEADDEE